MNNSLHIVTFDVPYPADYGGAIDVFYQIKALHKLDVHIHLHCFVYGDRKKSTVLEDLCTKVYYYQRKNNFLMALRAGPFIIESRKSDELLKNLIALPYHILFEGLHTLYYINHPKLKGRKKVFREVNIEHDYYYHLYKAEKNILKKLYYFTESYKLKRYEKIVKYANTIASVSTSDTAYYQNKYPAIHTDFIPCFHANENLQIMTGKGKYTLYHGNLSVAENSLAAESLINNVFSEMYDTTFYIAGKNPSQRLLKLVEKHKHIKLFPNPSDEEMIKLIREAHIHCLCTFQATGLKLKLLNTLYNGRFHIVNDKILNGSGLDEACIIADTADDFKKKIKECMKEEFPQEEINKREKLLSTKYRNTENGRKIFQLFFCE